MHSTNVQDRFFASFQKAIPLPAQFSAFFNKHKSLPCPSNNEYLYSEVKVTSLSNLLKFNLEYGSNLARNSSSGSVFMFRVYSVFEIS